MDEQGFDQCNYRGLGSSVRSASAGKGAPHFTVEFPYPEEDARRRIWEIMLPDEAPTAPNIDFDLLAERYRLTGGNIRNVALTAAFLAARDTEVIGMDHLLWATRREFQKIMMEPSDD